MFKDTPAFSGFSVSDLAEAKHFYGEVLGIEIDENPQGLELKIVGNKGLFIYPKDNHQPATYTILNFVVDDIDKAVNELKAKGVTFEAYEGMTDSNNIARGKAANRGPDIAWFKDPAGNFLSVLKN